MRTIRMLEDYPALSGIFDLFAEDEMSVFLDSSLQNELGQYSIVGVFPYLTLKNGDKFTVNGEECGQSFEAYVKEYLENHRDENDTGLPIVSGAVGYFSYDYGREKEGVESCHKEKVDIPACILCFYDVFLVESHKENRLYLIANGKTKDSGEMLDEVLKRIREVSDEEEEAAACEIQTESDFEESEYLKAVDDVIDYITEGDIYIMNMTRQLTVRSRRRPYQVFRALRRNNPSPFGGYFQYGDFQVVCASPERFLQMRGGHVVTRPIKGTRKRGENPQEDAMLRKELWESEKDRSELLMIVDLERNDLNRVCVCRGA